MCSKCHRKRHNKKHHKTSDNCEACGTNQNCKDCKLKLLLPTGCTSCALNGQKKPSASAPMMYNQVYGKKY